MDRVLFKLRVDFSFCYFFWSRALHTIIGKEKISVVHSHLFKADYFFSRVNEKYQLRHVLTNHGDYQLFREWQSINKEVVLNFDAKVNFIFFKIASIICISQKQKEETLRIYGDHLNEKLKVIYNGYSVEKIKTKDRQELNIPETSIVFGMIARGIEEKGWRFALDAFIKLDNPDCHLILVGDGEYLQSISEELRRYSNIHWVGFSKNPLEWIFIFDVGLLPSYYLAESQPNVLLECLSQGKPMICSNVGDVALILNTSDKLSQCGFVLEVNKCSPEIDVSKLIVLMRKYSSDVDLLRSHSANAEKRFVDFEMEKCAKYYIQEYFR